MERSEAGLKLFSGKSPVMEQLILCCVPLESNNSHTKGQNNTGVKLLMSEYAKINGSKSKAKAKSPSHSERSMTPLAAVLPTFTKLFVTVATMATHLSLKHVVVSFHISIWCSNKSISLLQFLPLTSKCCWFHFFII